MNFYEVLFALKTGTKGFVNHYETLFANALNGGTPTPTLSSITAVFNQGTATIYDTDTLDSLKQYLTVTATYDDSSTATVTTYTLSGTLTVGTSTITVTYQGKTDTFTVTVTHYETWELVRTIESSDISYQLGLKAASPYYQTQANRASYISFDIPIEYGYQYRYVTDTDVSTAQVGTQYHDYLTPSKVAANQNIGNILDPGWQTLNATYVPIGLINNTNAIGGVRFTSRMSTSNPTVTDGYINNIKVYRKELDYTLAYSLVESDFDRKTGTSGIYPYSSTTISGAKQKISYVNFDLLIDAGSTYLIEATSTYNTANMGMQFFNQNCLDAVSQEETFLQTDVYDPGWQCLKYMLTVPATYNSSPIKGLRLTFRPSSSPPSEIPDDFKITSVLIKKITLPS